MGTASLAASINANTHAARSDSSKCTNVRSMKMTAEIIRISQNGANRGSMRKLLAELAHCSLRTIDNWISKDRSIQFEQFFNLLDRTESAEGTAYFEAMWEQVPQRVRDRFFEAEALRRTLADRQRQREIEDRDAQARLRQLNMDLNASK
ncbi:hypothetical protein SAMN05444164_0680 [Bradyrhizobium erythrophlei]|uniref:Uncharacterized protein n=2 Tax=Nitrobacteraceae TaxID=41294 RepID=A0A1H4NN92_9BRAD|nr:hypothetical protein SAMN05444164_0680 [Bradyrhizobium erythrophlei]